MAHLTYKGKNPMTGTQWRHHYRKKKAEWEAFANKQETSEEKRTTVVSKAQRKPYSKKPNKEDKRANNQRPSMRVVQRDKDSYRAKVKTPKYSP